MAINNYLIEGVSGTGKSSVCEELVRLGYKAIDGDKELAYQGDPETGLPIEEFSHQNHIWDVAKVTKLLSDETDEVLFLCGGSRNFNKFIDKFTKVFVLNADNATIEQRISQRSNNSWGKNKEELELILSLNHTKEDIPSQGVKIDATKSLEEVVKTILATID